MNEKTKILLERTFRFGVDVLIFLNNLPEGKFYRIPMRQLARSSGSIGANYEEAQGAITKRDFYHKITISFKESRESHYWLRVLKELYKDAKTQKELDKFINEAQEYKNIFAAIQLSIKKNNTNKKKAN